MDKTERVGIIYENAAMIENGWIFAAEVLEQITMSDGQKRAHLN